MQQSDRKGSRTARHNSTATQGWWGNRRGSLLSFCLPSGYFVPIGHSWSLAAFRMNAQSSRCLRAGWGWGWGACVLRPVWSCLAVTHGAKPDIAEQILSSVFKAQTSILTHFACYRGKSGRVRYSGLLQGHMGNTLEAKVPADVYKKSEREKEKNTM